MLTGQACLDFDERAQSRRGCGAQIELGATDFAANSTTVSMKLLYQRHRIRIETINRNRHVRQLRRKGRVRSSRQIVASSVFLIELPKIFTVIGDDNLAEVLRLIATMQRTIFAERRAVFLNFDACESLGAGAALLLAAEVERAQKLAGMRDRMSVNGNYPKNQQVADFLDQVGFFELLRIKPPRTLFGERRNLGGTFIKMRKGIGAQARDSKVISDFASTDAAALSAPVRQRIASALNEAMVNVREHAYPKGTKLPIPPWGARWWMAGFHDHEHKAVRLYFYDQGASIPGTLPGSVGNRTVLHRLLKDFGLVGGDDGNLIRAASLLHSTRTGKKNRGKGLFDLQQLLRVHGHGELRILSRKGECSFRVDGVGQDVQAPIPCSVRSLPLTLRGTYIEWCLWNPPGSDEDASA